LTDAIRRLAVLPLDSARPLARMTNDAPGLSLLEELDARQNELLDELDRLNSRIEQVIVEWSAWRGALDAPEKLPVAA
jgi:hypothetical protein